MVEITRVNDEKGIQDTLCGSRDDAGYLHDYYAQSLSEFGKPRKLKSCGGWILERDIPGHHCMDARGCYPLFMCRNWSLVKADLKELENDLISLSLVTDPFGDYDQRYLKECFHDIVLPFKEHFIIDLNLIPEKYISRHHIRNAKKALKNISVEICNTPAQHLDIWMNLYENLKKRHDISGIPAFSRLSFAKQLDVPGLTMFCAFQREEIIGITLWYTLRHVVYYHLGAYSNAGYVTNASFALFWSAIRYFSDFDLSWLNLGSTPGIKSNVENGLTRFKRGWSSNTRTAYFCGHIFDHSTYANLTLGKVTKNKDYFPHYRIGEFS